ncbi:MAG TPA: GNAT family N-acetyltransferase [Thermomicrobiales bacterium]|nr:GNAT family N-acetyltransferase [Thermomicrobiales bacterium]HRA46628.1 GNAT family N-acetyltransferase [Thermomicrobiales bacterium]
MIEYRETADGIGSEQLAGFFVDWPELPSPEMHQRVLQASSYVVLAVDSECDRIVGFVTAISDGVLSSYIPLLEVLPGYQGQGIGTELMRRMLGQLDHLYMIDLLCDPDLKPFYRRVGMQPTQGMSIRNYAHQSGHAGNHDL